MATELKPLNDRLVIKPLQQEQVLSSGPGKRDDSGERVPLDIELGDRILYKKYTGQEIQIDNEDLIVLEEREVLAKLIV